jgi:hypothetical protein
MRKAAELIYTILEEKSPHVTEIEKVPENIPLSQTQITVNIFLIFINFSFIIGKICFPYNSCWLFDWQKWRIYQVCLRGLQCEYKVH